MRRPLADVRLLHRDVRTMSTYSVVREEGRRRHEERKIESIQPVLPSKLAINYDTVIPVNGFVSDVAEYWDSASVTI